MSEIEENNVDIFCSNFSGVFKYLFVKASCFVMFDSQGTFFLSLANQFNANIEHDRVAFTSQLY